MFERLGWGPTCVRYQRRDTAESLDRRRDQTLAILGVRHISGDGFNLGARRPTDLICCLPKRVLITAVDDDASALARKTFGSSPTQSPGGGRDNRYRIT
jgi:hypothetical protein